MIDPCKKRWERFAASALQGFLSGSAADEFFRDELESCPVITLNDYTAAAAEMADAMEAEYQSRFGEGDESSERQACRSRMAERGERLVELKKIAEERGDPEAADRCQSAIDRFLRVLATPLEP